MCHDTDFAQNQPTIRGVKSSYQIGDYVHANCSITFPRPHFKSMTKLVWFINNEPAPQAFVSSVKGRRMLSSLISSSSSSSSSFGVDSHNTLYNDGSVPTLSSKEHSGNSEISDGPWDASESGSNLNLGINNVMANSIKFLVNPRHFNQGLMR